MTPTANADRADQSLDWPALRVLLLLMATCFLGHFNRVSISVAADLRIMPEYDVTPTRMGWVYTSFLITYTLFMLPAGWVIDRRGVRFSLAVVLLGSAALVLATGGVGLAAGSAGTVVASLLLVRGTMGIVSTPMHPAAAGAVALGVPPRRRSLANGLVTAAALVGIAATYVVFGALVEWLDWPAAFAVSAAATALVGLIWVRWGPMPTPALKRDVARSTLSIVRIDGEEQPFLLSRLVGLAREHRSLLLLSGSYAAVGYLQYLFFYWMQYFFANVLDLTSSESRNYSAAATLAMAAGMFLGGWLSDRLETRAGWRVARAYLAIATMTASAAIVLVGIASPERLWTVACVVLGMGALGLAEGAFWTTAVEIGRQRGGLSAGVMNTGGNLGGLLAPVVTPWLSDDLQLGWQFGIAAGCFICLAGAVLWWWIDLDAAE